MMRPGLGVQAGRVEPLNYFLAGALILLGIGLVIRRLGNTDGAADWLLAWVCILVSGLDRLLIFEGGVLSLITPAWDTLFSLLLASGALRYSGYRRHLRWLWMVGVGVIAFRLLIEPLFDMDNRTLIATTVMVTACALTSWVIWQHSREQQDSIASVMSLMFLLPVFAQLHYTYVTLSGLDIGTAFFVWLVAGIVVIMTQMLLLVERARKEAAVQREVLARLAEQAPVGLCMTDARGHIQAMNASARRLFGEEDPAAATGVRSGDIHRLRSGQQLRVHRHALTPAGRDMGEVWFFEDLSLEADGQQAQSDYLRALRQMAGNVAHLFNNQLSVILGNAEMIQLAGHEDVRPYIEELIRATNRCSDIVSDFLQLAATSRESVFEPMAVGAIVSETVRGVAGEVDLSVRLDEDLRIQADQRAFRRALEELVSNALDAGASRIDISGTAAPDGYIDLRVEDDGRGIPAEHLSRVFEPFFTTKPAHMAAGLGLSLVHGIVNAHGGGVSVQRTERGTEVSSRWPVA